MKKDIHIPKVKEVALAVIEDGEDWIAYIINMNNFPIKNLSLIHISEPTRR